MVEESRESLLNKFAVYYKFCILMTPNRCLFNRSVHSTLLA